MCDMVQFFHGLVVSCKDSMISLFQAAAGIVFASIFSALQFISSFLLDYEQRPPMNVEAVAATKPDSCYNQHSPEADNKQLVVSSSGCSLQHQQRLDKASNISSLAGHVLAMKSTPSVGPAACAMSAQRNDDNSGESKQNDEHALNDQMWAEILQAEFDSEDKKHAESQMMISKQGKAWKFVHAVFKLHESLDQANESAAATTTTTTTNISDIKPVTGDNLVRLVERLIEKQEEFRAMKACCRVDLGYHYTKPENMERIATNGLLTLKDRTKRNIVVKHNGSHHGDGIYTSDCPTMHRNHKFGPVCLLVARLKGATSATVSANDTFVRGSLVVLRSSAQCVPLIQFTTEPDDFIGLYHTKLQLLIDSFFNSDKAVTVRPFELQIAATHTPAALLPSLATDGITATTAPSSIFTSSGSNNNPARVDKTIRYLAPDVLNSSASSKFCSVSKSVVPPDSNCSICLRLLTEEKIGKIAGCGHCFHADCILRALSYSSRCPLCSAYIVDPVGKSPSGKMKIKLELSVGCEGYLPAESIEIVYNIPSGIQKAYHSNHGAAFEGTKRTAYLPHNKEGLQLLKRLEYAFSHGLTFTVGTSLTTGKPNRVTWASIHHKTSRAAGSHGYPDLGYFYNCHDELDALGVPSAENL